MIDSIGQFFPSDVWKGAILGAVVSAAFTAAISLLIALVIRVLRLRPLQRVMGEFAGKQKPCLIFTNEMFTKDRQYLSQEPDYFPPNQQRENQQWVNVPYVVGTSDMQAAGDLLNLLGRLGKSTGIEFCSISKDWDRWDAHTICIGGNFKTWRAFETCEPRHVQLVPAGNTVVFKFPDSETRYGAENKNDHGVIFKTTIPATGKKCLIVMGMGALGSEAAAYFLRDHAALLGKMYGSRDFAFLVHARLDQGKQSARPCRCFPPPGLWRRILHPVLWFRTFRQISKP